MPREPVPAFVASERALLEASEIDLDVHGLERADIRPVSLRDAGLVRLEMVGQGGEIAHAREGEARTEHVAHVAITQRAQVQPPERGPGGPAHRVLDRVVDVEPVDQKGDAVGHGALT